jgi:hypothetical protein
LVFYDDDEFLPNNFSFFSQLEQDIYLDNSNSNTVNIEEGIGVILDKEEDNKGKVIKNIKK